MVEHIPTDAPPLLAARRGPRRATYDLQRIEGAEQVYLWLVDNAIAQLVGAHNILFSLEVQRPPLRRPTVVVGFWREAEI